MRAFSYTPPPPPVERIQAPSSVFPALNPATAKVSDRASLSWSCDFQIGHIQPLVWFIKKIIKIIYKK